MRRLSAAETSSSDPRGEGLEFHGKGVDVVLRVGRGLLEQIRAARIALGCQATTIHDMYQKNEKDILDQVRELCRESDRLMDSHRQECGIAEGGTGGGGGVVSARKRGKLIITFVSDLSHDARDAFVGIDNRGAEADCGLHPGKFVEASKRHGGRRARRLFVQLSRRPGDRVLAPICAQISHPCRLLTLQRGRILPERTYEAVRNLFKAHPTLDAIYNAAGGKRRTCESRERERLCRENSCDDA